MRTRWSMLGIGIRLSRSRRRTSTHQATPIVRCKIVLPSVTRLTINLSSPESKDLQPILSLMTPCSSPASNLSVISEVVYLKMFCPRLEVQTQRWTLVSSKPQPCPTIVIEMCQMMFEVVSYRRPSQRMALNSARATLSLSSKDQGRRLSKWTTLVSTGNRSISRLIRTSMGLELIVSDLQVSMFLNHTLSQRNCHLVNY